MSKKSDIYTLKTPWTNNENQIWIASTISLYRNIENFLFPSKLDVDKKKQLIDLLNKELQKTKLLSSPSLLKAEELTALEKEYLVEHFLTMQTLTPSHQGEAFVIDNSGKFLASLNFRNHLQLQIIETFGQIERGWNHLVKIETSLGRSLSYAFNPRFGFLTSNPAHSGTSFLLKIYLQPTALIHTKKLAEVLKRLLKEGLTISGIQGSPNEFIGDIVVLKNQYTLGLTEENIISMLRLFITKFLVEEQSTRKMLKKQENPEIMDHVSRSFGILIHSYQIEAAEAMNAISLLKLGVEMEWVKGVTIHELNHLFFTCRRSHLLNKVGLEVRQEELNHKRAEFIHKTLQKASLVIE